MGVITVSVLWNIVSEIFRNLISNYCCLLHSVCVLGSALDCEDGIYNIHGVGTSLVVDWLRLHFLYAGGLDSILGQGTRSHMLQLKNLHAAMKIKGPKCCK